jgi:multidrug resistance efflux pump
MEWFSATSNAKIDHQFAQINNPLQCIHRIATGADDPTTTTPEVIEAKEALDAAKQALAAAQEALEADPSNADLQADVADAETVVTNAENAVDQKRVEKDAAQEAYDEVAGGIGTTYKRMSLNCSYMRVLSCE